LWLKALQYGVAAGVEHEVVLRKLSCNTVIDVGSNRGQFALVARHCFPNAAIFAFEPLPEPAAVFRRLFAMDKAATLHNSAIGPEAKQCTMHVSESDDSSSLLPISSLQEELFPGTSEVESVDVSVAPLDSFLRNKDIVRPAMLKLDVQGFELDALRGCESLLASFEWVYCECSFVELYSGQKLAADIIEWLSDREFRIQGMYNPSYDRNGKAIQADFLFRQIG
jgi:FkbM family methyltransferase